MQIHRQIQEYLVYETEPISRAVEKINDNKKRIAFVITNDGKLRGSISDGDLRRWIAKTSSIDLSREVYEITNRNFCSINVNASRQEIVTLFTKAIDTIPLIDDYGKFVAVAINSEPGIYIGNHIISERHQSFIIAEIGNNHNGDLELAKQLVDFAKEANADCAKFQIRDLNSLYQHGHQRDFSADLGAQYTYDLLSKNQLQHQEMIKIFDYCYEKAITPLCTPWDIMSLEFLESYGMEAYKVASADLTNLNLLDALVKTKKPLICSTGMSRESEILNLVDFLKAKGAEFILLHCNSTYPTPLKDVNLAYLENLKKISGRIVGYSGHERGITVPIAAVALGAKVIEKHFTLDKNLEGNDHKISLLPSEFKEMVSKIREVEEAMGKNKVREISQGELINREVLAKSLVINCDLASGKVIKREMINIKSPGQGLQPMYINQLVGKIAKRNFSKGDVFFNTDISEEILKPKDYKFNRPFGIPVRYHDFSTLAKMSNFDLVEFHLSYQDMEIDPTDYLEINNTLDFVVHSPELFADDHILNLAEINDQYRIRSINELDKVCSITRKLKQYFSKTTKPMIIVNVGGFTENNFLGYEERFVLYERVAESLNQINQSGIEIIIQTMPPFPWHFGGQRYHNLFVDADEIRDFCEKYKYRICFDISHSMMACNYYGWNLSDFTKKIATYNAHLHIVDAKGIDGEGIQIGEGDVNFKKIALELNNLCPKISFVPEVWQGHKNKGHGFWHALSYLEKYFHEN